MSHMNKQLLNTIDGGGEGLREDRHGLFNPNLTEGEDTPHSSPSQTGGLLSATTAPPLTIGAELETGLKGPLTATT